MTVGVFDAALHAEWKLLPHGPRKSRVGSQLIRENTPLVKVLVSQMLGNAAPTKRRTMAQRMGGKEGFRDIDEEDAMQLGLMALSRALETFDPSKSKLAGYVATWMRHFFQRHEVFCAHLCRAPQGKGDQRPRVGFVGMGAEDDERSSAEQQAYFSGSASLGDILASDDVTKGEKLVATKADDWEDLTSEAMEDGDVHSALEEWNETGVWPERLASTEAYRASRPKRIEVVEAPKPVVVYSLPPAPPPTWLDTFLRKFVVVTSAGRGDEWEVQNLQRVEASRHGATPLSLPELRQALHERHGVHETRARVKGFHFRALAGVRLRFPGEVAVYV